MEPFPPISGSKHDTAQVARPPGSDYTVLGAKSDRPTALPVSGAERLLRGPLPGCSETWQKPSGHAVPKSSG